MPLEPGWAAQQADIRHRNVQSRLKVGVRFYHSRVLNERNQPALYIVTRIAQGVVYYRPVAGGHSQCCPIEQFPRWCKEIT